MIQPIGNSRSRLWRILLVLALVAIPTALLGAPGVGAEPSPTGDSMDGMVKSLVSGWYRDDEVRYYDFGMNTPLTEGNDLLTAPIYVLVYENMDGGDPEFVEGQHNIIDVVPGDDGYSDLWQVMLVTVPADYEPDSIRSAAEITEMVYEVTATDMYVNCPIVPEGTMLENGEELVQGWYQGEAVYYPDFGLNPPVAIPIWAFITGMDSDGNPIFVEGQRNIIDAIPGDEGYSAFWRVNLVTVPEDYEPNSIRNAADVSAMGYEVTETDLVVNCPVITEAPDEHLATYRVTLTNNSPQVFSPPVFVAHSPDNHLFQAGSAASDALRQLAEDGNPGPLAELAQNAGAHAVVVADGPLPPGESLTVEITTPKLNSRISVASMLVQTNDAFTGFDSAWVPGILGGYNMYLHAYDAGTEVNNELAGYVPGPPFGGTMREPENNVIHHHPGLRGVGDVSVEEFGWSGSVAKLSVTRAENAENPGPSPVTSKYRVTITNLTEGQVFSPPLVSIHHQDIRLWEEGETASPGLVALAEMGDNSALGEEASMHGALWVEMLAEGVMPGQSVSVEFDAHRLENRISLAMMLVSTNDGFTGVNGAMLPANLSTTDIWAYVYDAGSEVNNEMADFIPGLGGTMRDPEVGFVSHHPGVAGVADLDPMVHGWDGPVAHIRVERVSD